MILTLTELKSESECHNYLEILLRYSGMSNVLHVVRTPIRNSDILGGGDLLVLVKGVCLLSEGWRNVRNRNT